MLQNNFHLQLLIFCLFQELEADKQIHQSTYPPVFTDVFSSECKHLNDILDNASIQRYSRQLILPEIGPRGMYT